jgi:hypothetical protein
LKGVTDDTYSELSVFLSLPKKMRAQPEQQKSIVRAMIVSAPAKGIGFRQGRYVTTLGVMGFGVITEFGYTTVSHHQALRMIMVSSRRAVAVHPTIQQQLSSTTGILVRAVCIPNLISICMTRCSMSHKLSTLLELTSTTD